VFRVVDREMRQCLICDGLFTPQGAACHVEKRCLPSQRSFDSLETTNANR
jgi:hypothetical protein